MRAFCFMFLVAFAVAVGVFAYQNDRPVTVNVFGHTQETSFPIMAGALYLLGMVSGWTVVGMLKRSLQRVSENDRQ